MSPHSFDKYTPSSEMWEYRQITADEDTRQIEATYEKDENGLYPWEADTDNSPERVTPDCKPMVRDWGPKRGRWR